MIRIKRFFECLLPVTVCNLKCKYCYVIQRENRLMKIPELKYSPDKIGKALNKERLGGTCFFSICGAGETLIPNYTVDIVKNILEQGHIVNITTNGTLANRFKELSEFPEDLKRRLNISFSLHYDELKERNMLNQFVQNVKLVQKNGISFVIQLNLCDQYIKEMDEIKNFCKSNFDGSLPQVALTRRESKDLKKIKIDTELSYKEYKDAGDSFDSPLFSYTFKNFNYKRREFCYAGDWSGTLNLETGILTKCYISPTKQNIFENIKEPIKFEAIGNNCRSPYCFNSSHFMSLGIIPELDKNITYAKLRNREESKWYNETLNTVLNEKLVDCNKLYSRKKKIIVNIKNKLLFFVKDIYQILKKIIKKVIQIGR